MAEEPKFVIDGTEYPIPELDDFTMGEALVLYDYTGLSIDQVDEDAPRMPLVAAFMHIAYQRGHPDASDAKVKRLVRDSNLQVALERFSVEEEDVRPPDQPPSEQPEKPFGSEHDSGSASTNGSTEPATGQSLTGTPGSDTPVISDRVTSRT
jgi:hypothetical protein